MSQCGQRNRGWHRTWVARIRLARLKAEAARRLPTRVRARRDRQLDRTDEGGHLRRKYAPLR
jgi:hypothetical protein